MTWIEALDGTKGRKPICEMYTDAGWQCRWEWQIHIPGYVWSSTRTRLIVKHNQRDGTTYCALEGMDVEIDDGA